MFRLVTQYVEKPAFLLICDNIECSRTLHAEASLSELNPISLPQQELGFLNESKRQGWLLSMRIHLCPGHHKQLQDVAPKVVEPK